MAQWTDLVSERGLFFRQKLLETFSDLNEFFEDKNILNPSTKPISLEAFLDDLDAVFQRHPQSPVFWSCQSSAIGRASEDDDRETRDTSILGDDEDDVRLHDVRVTSPTWVTNNKSRLNSVMYSGKYRIAIGLLILADLIVVGALTDLRGANVGLSVVTSVTALLYVIDDTLLFMSADAALTVWFKVDVTITFLRILVELEDVIVAKGLRVDIHLASFRVLACLKLVPRSTSCQIVLVAVVKGYGSLLYLSLSCILLIVIAATLAMLTLAFMPPFGWAVVYKQVTGVGEVYVMVLLVLLTLIGLTARCLLAANIGDMLVSCRDKLVASDRRKQEIRQCSESLNNRRQQLRQYHSMKSFVDDDEQLEDKTQMQDGEQVTTDVLACLHEMSTERRPTVWSTTLLFDYINLQAILHDNLQHRQLLLAALDHCVAQMLLSPVTRQSAAAQLHDFVMQTIGPDTASQSRALDNLCRQLDLPDFAIPKNLSY